VCVSLSNSLLVLSRYKWTVVARLPMGGQQADSFFSFRWKKKEEKTASRLNSPGRPSQLDCRRTPTHGVAVQALHHRLRCAFDPLSFSGGGKYSVASIRRMLGNSVRSIHTTNLACCLYRLSHHSGRKTQKGNTAKGTTAKIDREACDDRNKQQHMLRCIGHTCT